MILHECPCGCERRLEMRDGKLWLIDSLLEFEEEVKFTKDNCFVNGRHTLNQQGLAVVRSYLSVIKEA